MGLDALCWQGGHIIYGEYRDGALTRRHEYEIRTTRELWEALDALNGSKTRLHVFGHSMGTLLQLGGFWREVQEGRLLLMDDHWQLRDLLPRRDNKPWRGMLVLTDPPTIVSCRNAETGRELSLVDALNYCTSGLEQLYADAMVDKASLSDDRRRALESHDQSRRGACAIESFMLSLFRACQQAGGCQWRPTAAGLAWSLWSRTPERPDVFIHGSSRALELERAACFGGRVLGTRHGHVDEQVEVLDVNSLYPAVMHDNDYPCRLLEMHPDMSLVELRGALNRFSVIAECRVRSNHNEYPLRIDGRPTYRRGDFWTVLSTPEIAEADRNGELVELGEVCLYERARLFQGWVARLYNLRCRARDQGANSIGNACKLLMNGLAGKFSQRSDRWEWDDSRPSPIEWGHWASVDVRTKIPHVYRAIMGRTQKQVNAAESADSFPAIFAHITAYARMLMRDCFNALPRGALLYSDTDSIHTTGAGLAALHMADLLDDSGLGRLRHQRTAYSAHYWGQKDYQIGDMRVCGAITHAAEEIRPREFRVALRRSATGALQEPDRDCVPVREVITRLADYHFDGILQPDGKVIPHEHTESYESWRDRERGQSSRPNVLRAPTYIRADDGEGAGKIPAP
jgi:hypothetical protein